MKREVIKTSDGSTTIYLKDIDEHYHSKHGAINEAYHVFIRNGLDIIQSKEASILEIGFGTGLNAFITLLEAEKRDLKIKYDGVEAYPVSENEIKLLNFMNELKVENKTSLFNLMHHCIWGSRNDITNYFNLKKRKQSFFEIDDQNTFDLIYFDAFGARVQPELWTDVIFLKMYTALKPRGILVTYAAKGSVRRTMLKVGFSVERLPGPPGKREMLRATKS